MADSLDVIEAREKTNDKAYFSEIVKIKSNGLIPLPNNKLILSNALCFPFLFDL